MGHTKYPTILSVVKAALTLAHGNSEVERGFSDSGKSVIVDRTCLSKVSINNLWIAADGLKVLGGLPHHVPITSSFIKLDQSAHKNYQWSEWSQCRKEKRSWEKKTGATRRRQKKQIQEKNKLEKETDQVKSSQVYFLFS